MHFVFSESDSAIAILSIRVRFNAIHQPPCVTKQLVNGMGTADDMVTR
jgi:hypothetical protein